MLQKQSIRRFVSMLGSRRGSMLIMVIVILVLLALIGTAMMSGARIDRLASSQNNINTQVDLLLESAKNLAKAAIQNDVYGTVGGVKKFRTGLNYYNYDSVSGTSDTYLSSRLPDSGPTWPFITQLPNTTFESPLKPASGPLTWSTRQNVAIGSQLVNGISYPAFGNYIVGDADGDGIADAGLVKFPIGEINGVTYYYSLRIVDNNSAINAATAWSSTSDYKNTASTTLVTNYGFFPSNVAFGEYLTTATEMDAYNQWRLGNSSYATPPAAVTENGASGAAGTNTTDFVYASLGDLMNNQIAKRIANPGYVIPGTRAQALPVTDSISMAYKFCLKNAYASPSILETKIPASVYGAGVPSKPYLASNYGNWYTTNFDFTLTARPMRSYLVARNPVANVVSAKDTTVLGAYTTQLNPIPANGATLVTKTSVNTASFGYLWRGFWNVMSTASGLTPTYNDSADTITPVVDGRMFREVLRDPRPRTPARSTLTPTALPMTSSEVMMLRSSIAAVNTLALRGTQKGDYTIPSRRVFIRDSADLTKFKYEAMVYGGAPQPFITEVYANTSPAYGSHGYVAIELYNPYNFDISLANYNLGVIHRPIPGTAVAPRQNYPYLQMFPITSFKGFGAPGTAPKIPAKGRLILNNVGVTSAKDLGAAPAGEGVPTGLVAYVPNLSEVFSDPLDLAHPGGELVLLRPRRQILNTAASPNVLECDALTKSTNTLNFFDETQTTKTPTSANLIDLVPVDSYDFTGLAVGTPASWHYVRQNSVPPVAPAPDPDKFKQVYPGKYTSTAAAATPRTQGTQISDGTAPVLTVPTLGLPDPAASSYSNLIPPIQWFNTDFAGPSRSGTTASTNVFPFGGFARAGDMLQIPFIGSYRIRDVVPATGVTSNPLAEPVTAITVFREMNAVTMDASLAEDGDSTDDADEMLGRFCPLNLSKPNAYDPTVLVAPQEDWYKWTSALFDYFTTSTPTDDYFPNVDPGTSDHAAYTFTYADNAGAVKASGTLVPTPKNFNYPLGAYTTPAATMIPGQVKNGTYVAEDSRNAATKGFEQYIASEGLVNINTAPLQVLAALPWSTTQVNNKLIANYVKAYRDGTAPYATAIGVLNGAHVFTSIADLNKIVDPTDATKTFQNGFGTMTATDPDDADGDISPAGVNALDGVTGDFEQKFLRFTKVSSLITTRSDSFTVYVLVQGWKNTGTATPELVATRRAAFIVDRSALSDSSTTLNVTSVPAD